MDLRIQVPGRSYFSIGIVIGLRRHTLWSFWVNLHEEGYAPLVSPVAMPGDDSGLERSVALGPFASASGSVTLS